MKIKTGEVRKERKVKWTLWSSSRSMRVMKRQ